MEHGTTWRRKNSTGEKYSTRVPVLELSFLRVQKISRRKAIVVAAAMPSAEARDSSGSFFGAFPDKMPGRKRRGSAPPPHECGGSHRKAKTPAGGQRYELQDPD